MNLREFSAALRVARHYSGSDAGEEAVERLTDAFAKLLLENAEAVATLRALYEAASNVALKPCDGRSHTYPPTEPCEECENASFLSKRIADADAVLAKHPVKP